SAFKGMSLWKRVDLLVNGRTPLAVYTSLRTGLRFAIGDVPGPMVKACVSLVTEAHSDDGLPHTLEHLVFMGSEKYPFKGFLDVIANRCFASGTNAWTDQDHTAYTIDTVGAEGFYKSFPVYLNHILRPTLTKSQYLTEVHHINEKGEDGGVVYCEMQDHESEMDSILDRRMRRLLYPDGHGYAIDTGGKLEAIRNMCSIDRVRDFHKKFYHVGNVFSIICGKVDHMRVQKILEELEEAELTRVPADFKTPFSTPVPSLSTSIVETVECPSDDPSHGGVHVAWFGPPSRDCITSEALDVLFNYFTDTAVSPFHRNFIDIPEPLASHAGFHMSEQTTSCITLGFQGVPADKLDQVLPIMEKVLKQHQEASAFDAERMGFVCQQAVLNAHAALETGPSKNVFHSLITHQLYGEASSDDLEHRMNDAKVIEQLAKEPMQYWADLVTRFFSAPSVSLIGKPSETMIETLAEKESSRVAAQREKLGCDGLDRCKADHCKAVTENTSGEPPKELLDSLMVNDFDGFDTFHIDVYHSEDAASAPAPVKSILDSFPFPATVHHSADTRFVELWLAMDTAALTVEQRKLLYVFSELPFESPAVVDGQERKADDVCCLFTRDLLEHSLHTGFSSSFDRALVLWLKVDAARYGNVAKWAEIFLQGIKIDASKIKSIATRLAGDARENKRDGNYVCQTAMNGITYRHDSNAYIMNELILQKVHEQLAKEVKTDPKGVIARFEELRTTLLSSGFNAHVLCDAAAVAAGKQPPTKEMWAFAARDKATPRLNFSFGEETAESFTGKEIIVPLGSCESSFMIQNTPFVCDWNSEVLAPVLLLTQYLSQCEGPLWKSVRGNGLAYGIWISTNVDVQELSMTIYRSANIPEAYAKVEQIVKEELTRGSLDATQFEAAKRSLICDLYRKVATVSSAGSRSVLSVGQKKDPGYLRRLSQTVWDSDPTKVLALGTAPILALFSNYSRAVCSHTRQAGAIKKTFPAVQTIKIDSVPITANS
ncbi:hypothetical protein PFISCL1PPCAC_11273, partial [Pristionchus fissidentatus]